MISVYIMTLSLPTLFKNLLLRFAVTLNASKKNSNSGASQYKIFLNSCHHKDDFDVKTEWHFSACDGLGRTVKLVLVCKGHTMTS